MCTRYGNVVFRDLASLRRMVLLPRIPRRSEHDDSQIVIGDPKNEDYSDNVPSPDIGSCAVSGHLYWAGIPLWTELHHEGLVSGDGFVG